MVWELLARIWRLQRLLREEAEAGLRDHGVSGLEAWLLRVLKHHPHPTEAARRMGLPLPTVSHMVRRLEAQGLLLRAREEGDLRRFRLFLTPKGERVLEEAERLFAEALKRRLDRLDGDEEATLLRLLDRLLEEA
ncbi:MarR family transcriptional regulator [Thermus sp.]|uniref:MarR family winged helix-turn-helix transcriptional regulator n=1 Tax=Thermus sp. TaxID=275 RepID=UPI00307F5A28